MAAGQLLDLISEGCSDVGLEQLELIRLKKSATLLEASVVIGSMMGGGSSEQTEILRKFARSVGVVFCQSCKSHIPHWLWSGFACLLKPIKGPPPSSLFTLLPIT